MPKRKAFIILGVIALISLLLRIENYREMKANNPIFNYPLVDSKEYVQTAKEIMARIWLADNKPYYHPPVYPYFIAMIYSISAEDMSNVKWVQIAIDTLNVMLVFLVGSMVFGTATALLASGLYGLYLPVIQFTSELLPPILLIFFFLLGLLCILKYGDPDNSERSRVLWAVSAGIVFGLLVLTVPSFLLCVGVIALWMTLYAPGRMLLRAGSAGIFVVVVMMFVLLTFARNYYVSEEPVLISMNSGINLYAGNNEDINRTVSLRPGRQWERFTRYPYESERITGSAEEIRFWYKKTFEYIFSHPFDWLLLMGKKTILFFNSYEFPRNFDNAFYGEFTRLGRMPLVNLRIIMPLGLCGMLFALFRLREKRNAESIKLLLFAFAGYAASIILIFVAGRYRMPVIPILILFAAYTVTGFIRNVRDKNHAMYAARLAVIVLLVLLTVPRFFEKSYPYTISMIENYTMMGLALQEHGRMKEASVYFQKALEEPVDSFSSDMYVNVALFHVAEKSFDKAAEYLEKAYKLNPQNHYALNNLGYSHALKKEFDKAIYYYKLSIHSSPCQTRVYQHLVMCYMSMKQPDEALKALMSFYTECPSPHPIISYQVGLMYMRYYKDCDKALAYFRESLRYPQGIPEGEDVYKNIKECMRQRR